MFNLPKSFFRSLLLALSTVATPAMAATVVEFYNTNLDNYFITADANEAAAIDGGSAGPGWIRTGDTFNSGGSTPVCRFYGSQSPGPNSHFYTADAGECAYLKQLQATTPATEKRWNFESDDFVSTPPTNGTCPIGTEPVYRAYNNGASRGIDSNHRITTNLTAIQQVMALGWSSEGLVMCAPGKSSGINSAMGGIVADTSGASVTVPPDALMSVYANVAITSTPLQTGTPLPVSLQGSVTSVSEQYTLSQDSGFSFTTPVTVTIPYDTTGLAASDVLVVAYYDTVSGKWVPISDGVDNRAAGTFTFSTTHFSLWLIGKMTAQVAEASYSTGFNPALDGIPIVNFATDGAKTNGNCAGMSGLAGWYFTNKKNTDGNAETRFSDSSALRNYLTLLQSKWSEAGPQGLNWADYSVHSPNAAEAIRKKLSANNRRPILANILSTDQFNHYVLIYEYSASGLFKYYDPNYPGKEQNFNSSFGGVENWKSGPHEVSSFTLYNSIEDRIAGLDLLDFYSSFTSGSQQWIMGKVDLQATLTSDSIEITGSVTTDTHLAGKVLYVHFFAPAKSNVSTQDRPPAEMVEIFPDQPRPITTSGGSAFSTDVFMPGNPAAFAASFKTNRFMSGAPVTLTVKVSTGTQIATSGLWAFGEVTLPQMSTTSTPICTLPQVLTNGMCVTPTQPTITTTLLLSATVNTGYAQGMAASGGQTPYTWSASSGLPSGLNINSATGVISGTPTVSGTFNVTVTVKDSSSPQKTTSKPLSLTVSNPVALTPTVSYVTPSTITQGAGSQSVTITGSNFTSSSYHQYSVSGGGSWAWATVAPTINSPTSMTISVANTALQTMSYRVCATYGDTTSCSGSVAVTVQAANVAYSLSLGTSGTGSGTISYTGGNVCPSSCSQNYNSGATITLTANANAGSTFAGWSGACTGTGSCTVTMSAAKSVTATFSANSLAVNGVCGSSLNGTFATAPTANLCNVGAPSAVSTGTPWSWSCSGSSGGTTASCWAFPVATATPPGLPTNLTSNAVSSSQINLSWSASTAGSNAVAGYSIERCMGPGCSNYATLTSTASTNYSDTGLSGGTFYAYRLRAYDNAGNYSNPTGSVSAITPASVSVPVAAPVPSCNISPATATILSGASQIFSASCTNSPTAYQWRVDGNLWSVGGAGPTSSDTFSGLAAGSHTVTVTADNAGGTSVATSASLTVNSAPDLQISGGTVSPTSVSAGSAMVFNWSISNQGTGAANASTTVVSINQSASSAAGSNLLTVNMNSLASGGSQPQAAYMNAPSTAGTYYVWGLADNNKTSGQSASAAANDTVLIGSFTVVAAPATAPDLLILAGSVSPTTLSVGGSMYVSWQISNQGTSTANASTTAVRFNQSTTSAAGSNLASISMSSLPFGVTPQTQQAYMAAPTTAGTYYVWVIADSGSTAGQNASAVANDTVRIASFTVLAPTVGYVSQGGLTWMPVSVTRYSYNDAAALCSSTINGQTGWRLPTKDELVNLYNSGAMNGQGWTLDQTYSSTSTLSGDGNHLRVYLQYGIVGSGNDANAYYATCVR